MFADQFDPRHPAVAPTVPEIGLGQVLSLSLLDQARWIHRRVESVEFLDDRTVRRSVSVDFSVPHYPELELSPLGVVPLAFLRKRPLMQFDVRDESGNSLPVLTKHQNAHIAWSTLAGLAQAVLAEGGEQDFPPGLLDQLRTLVSCDADEADALLEEYSDTKTGPAADLLGDDLFHELATDLAHGFLLLVPVNLKPGSRRVLKFSYSEDLEDPDLVSLILSSTGIRRSYVSFELPAIGDSMSYHFECQAPERLTVHDAALFVETDEDIFIGTAVTHATRAHLYIEGPLPPRTEAQAIIVLARSRFGLAWLALVTAVTMALLLSFLRRYLGDFEGEPSTAVTLLLAIPGVASLLVAQPGEHSLATRVFRGSRLLVSLLALLSLASATSLVVGMAPENREILWDIFLRLTWIIVALLGLGLLGLDWLIGWLEALIFELKIKCSGRREKAR